MARSTVLSDRWHDRAADFTHFSRTGQPLLPLQGRHFADRPGWVYAHGSIFLPTPIEAKAGDTIMHGIISKVATRMTALLRREPTMRFGGNTGGDWLPPVFGLGDWSSAAMASMADADTAWYFDRSQPRQREA